MIRRAALVPLVLVMLALPGCGGGDSGDSGDPIPGSGRSPADDALVARYCAYDSQTHSAIIACFEQTSPFQVRGQNSNAAKYALGQGGCRADSGPFCQPPAGASTPQPGGSSES